MRFGHLFFLTTHIAQLDGHVFSLTALLAQREVICSQLPPFYGAT
jgi:hypothetical protein